MLIGHGWKSTDDLTYIRILERPEVSLYDFAFQGVQDWRVFGSIKLVSPRVLLSVLETIETVYTDYDQVLASLDPHELFVRQGW